MRNFRTLEQAKKDLKVIQDYVDLIENYQPKDFRQHVIHTYMHLGSLEKTSEALNEKGFKINDPLFQGDRLLEPEDIKIVITKNPPKDDLLHKKLKTLYLRKTRASRQSYKPTSSGTYKKSIY